MNDSKRLQDFASQPKCRKQHGRRPGNRRESTKVRVLLISAANDAGAMTPLPLGLACVAGAAENAGHNVRLLPLGTDADYENDLRQAIQQFSPDVLGLTTLRKRTSRCLEISSLVDSYTFFAKFARSS
jgi:hypothetical protein